MNAERQTLLAFFHENHVKKGMYSLLQEQHTGVGTRELEHRYHDVHGMHETAGRGVGRPGKLVSARTGRKIACARELRTTTTPIADMHMV